MRPIKFGKKPTVNSIERFKRTTRLTPIVSRFGYSIIGTPQEKANQVALKVLEKLPISEEIKGMEKKRIFRINAENSLMRRNAIGAYHCAERCNLAIALLNASGVKAWLARVLVMPEKKVKGTTNWHFHDVVEFSDGKKVNHLMFDNNKLDNNFSYAILSGAVDFNKNSSRTQIVFRGADSKQIGGVGNWNEYQKYSKKLDSPKGIVNEFDKNKRRIDLLVHEGIIPENALFYI